LNRLNIYPLHPFLIAVYPALALLGHNIEEIRASVALRALLFSLLACLLLLLLFRALLRRWNAAALATTAALALFFSYGHVYNFFKGWSLAGWTLARHRLLAPLWLGVLILFIVWLARKKSDPPRLHGFLNLAAVIALVFPIFQLSAFALSARGAPDGEASSAQEITNLKLPPGQPAPDIYYIILDAYTRDDTLLSEYGLDNTPFLDQLEGLGFYVARCSQSNYAQTQLSLASSLNFNYLEALDEAYNPGNNKRVGMRKWIQHSAARTTLEGLGYQVVAFETGFKNTEWDDADLYLAPSAALGSLQMFAGLNDFELLLINNSAGLLLTDAAIKLPEFLQTDFDNPRRIHRERILYALDQLAKLPALPGPKFVFAHLVIPHPPYVFGPDGEFTDYDRDKIAAYHDQVIYLNQRLIPLLESILQESSTPPIIVLQGDHGGIESPQAYRMDILNAYHLPGGGNARPYENISPVNTFRVIFNQYYGAQFALLDDTSYFSVYKTPFEYTVIPNRREGCP